MTHPLPLHNGLQSKRVLVVEDHEEVAWLIGDVLTFDGAKVTIVKSIDRACHMLDKHTYDLLICEITVDGNRGETVVEHAALAQPHLRACTMVTTRDPFGMGRRQQLARLGRVVLYKPFSTDALRGLAMGLVRRTESQAA